MFFLKFNYRVNASSVRIADTTADLAKLNDTPPPPATKDDLINVTLHINPHTQHYFLQNLGRGELAYNITNIVSTRI